MDFDAYIGEIRLFPYNFAPEGWILCDGTKLQTRENMALYSLISTTYGGDGTTNFAVPDLRGKEPIANVKYYIALQGIYPTRP